MAISCISGCTYCMHFTKQFFFFLLLSFPALIVHGQTTYHGIVVDSASVSALRDVHVKIKNSARGVITNARGAFIIEAQPTDTLVFTRIGYSYFELPLLFEETALFIRLAEQINVLKEITISATRLIPSTIIRSPRKEPRPMSTIQGIFSPIDYFSKWQKEKRKLLKYIQENDRTITYLQVVMDQETREFFMEEFSLSEEKYFDLLAKFNQQSGALQYSTDAQEIKKSLKGFLSKMAR